MTVDIKPAPPMQLLPVDNPGTPTVSNTRAANTRCVLRNLRLELRVCWCFHVVREQVTVNVLQFVLIHKHFSLFYTPSNGVVRGMVFIPVCLSVSHSFCQSVSPSVLFLCKRNSSWSSAWNFKKLWGNKDTMLRCAYYQEIPISLLFWEFRPFST